MGGRAVAPLGSRDGNLLKEVEQSAPAGYSPGIRNVVVEKRRIELPTSALRTQRSPS